MSAAHDDGDDDEGHILAHEEHAEHEGEPWLVSYADMMTLLFGFFVVLYSFAAAKLDRLPADLDSMVMMRKEVAQHFGGAYVAPLQEVAAQLDTAVKTAVPDAEYKIEVTPEGMEATFTSQTLFASGSAEVSAWARDALGVLGRSLVAGGFEYQVVVEGHTDDVPVVAMRHLYPSNWELSSARAATVIRVFETVGLAPQSLTAVGFGASRPAAPNRDAAGAEIPANMAKNRRIAIKVAVVGKGAPKSPDILQRVFGASIPEAKP